MRSRDRIVLALSLTVLIPLPALAGGGSSVETRRDPKTCADYSVRFDGDAVARGEETLTVRAGRGPLKLRPHENGGITIRGGAGADYKVTVCKFAGGTTQGEAERRLAEAKATATADGVTVDGPDESFTAFLIVDAPRDANLDVATSNGPVSISDLGGTLMLKAENGPVSLRNVDGSIDVEAENGPISLKEASGSLRIRGQNGPLTIELSGMRWDGEGLDASTENGPLTVKVPEGYVSSLSAETSSWAPASCKAEMCGDGKFVKRDGRKVLESGSGSPIVKVSTKNGPLSVGTTRGR